MGIISGFYPGTILTIGAMVFPDNAIPLDVVPLFAIRASMLMTSLIGNFDDLVEIRQWLTALLPAFAALPLMAIRAGHTVLTISF